MGHTKEPESAGDQWGTEEWEKRLGRELLKSVSRTFYLTLRLLPREVRGPVSLAYLLARATDTVADTSEASPESRRRLLDRCRHSIETGESEGLVTELARDIIPAVEHSGERKLLTRFDDCLSWLKAVSDSQRDLVQGVLRPITDGQGLDLERFPSAEPVHALQDAAETDRYTYCVAGSVGEFWTVLCAAELGERCFDEEVSQMAEWGIALGRGLQLVNILRDLPRDWERGRCYLPQDEIVTLGGSLTDSPRDSTALRSVSATWERQCETHLDQGLSYVLSIASKRLRLATAMPLLYAIRSLRLVQAAAWEKRWDGIKMSRGEVKGILARATVKCLSRSGLEAYYKELGRKG
jgi:farnesyl-diphosphate farnesyltransferase